MSDDNGKTPIDQTERLDGESVGVWLARLIVRAQPSEVAFANLRDAARPKLTDNPLAAELAFMRAHQAVGQFRACAHAAWRYLDVLDELMDDACRTDRGYERWGGE